MSNFFIGLFIGFILCLFVIALLSANGHDEEQNRAETFSVTRAASTRAGRDKELACALGLDLLRAGFITIKDYPSSDVTFRTASVKVIKPEKGADQ